MEEEALAEQTRNLHVANTKAKQMEKDCIGLKSRIRELESKNSRQDAELQKTRMHLQQTETNLMQWSGFCKRLEQELAQSGFEHQHTKKELQSMTTHIRDLEINNAQESTLLQETRGKLQRTQGELDKKSALLDLRSAELKATKVFLDTADSFGEAEIIQMMRGLNEQIFQCCANIADAAVSEEESVLEDDSILASHRQDLAEIIGPGMVASLESSRKASDGDPLPLQTALQMLLAQHYQHILTAFDIGNHSLNAELSRVYENTLLSQEQAIAGRWRSLTMANLHSVPSNEPMNWLLERIIQTLILGGFSEENPSYGPLVTSLTKGDNPRLAPIEETVWKLREAICQGVTSCDIAPLVFDGALPFDPVNMEDMYPEEDVTPHGMARDGGPSGSQKEASVPGDERAKGLPILGTVQLGLLKAMSVKTDEGIMRQEVIISKPKVVLARTLEEEL